jgi:hypothetical protein
MRFKRNYEMERFIRDHRELFEEILEHIQYLVVLKGYNPKDVHPPFNKHSVKSAARFIMSSIRKHCAIDW